MSASTDVVQRRRWTVDEYRSMGESDAPAPDARVELIDGEIVDTTPIGSVHAGIVTHLNAVLSTATAGVAIVSVQNPVALSDRSEPEPDLMLLCPREDFYKGAYPTVEDVLLVIEVADATLARDSGIKRSLYATHGVSNYWIVDVPGRRIVAFAEPGDGDYARETVPDDLRSVKIDGPVNTSVDLHGLFDH